MPKRKTIGKNPFAEVAAEPLPAAKPAKAVKAPRPAPPSQSLPALKDAVRSTARRFARVADENAGAAVGGHLEILGGDVGFGGTTIWRFGRNQQMGFSAPNGRMVDLETELQSIRAWRDRDEHRVLSAVGWAWALGSLTGILGIVAGGGIRLMQPRRMILEIFLRDGRKIVARTDGVTAAALEDLSRSKQKEVIVEIGEA